MPVFGVIAPHPPIMLDAVGAARSGVTSASLSASAVVREALREFKPETLVVMSPHAPAFSDAFVVDDSARFSGDLAQFGDCTDYAWPGDPELAVAILQGLADDDVASMARSEAPRLHAGQLDHGTIVPLSLIEPTGETRIVVLSLSFMSYEAHRVLGRVVRVAAETCGRRVAFIASGDLSHRLTHTAPAGYSPQAHLLDEAIVEHVRIGDFEGLAKIDPDIIEAGGECGLRSFIALGGFCGAGVVPTRVLSYEGPWGVGYLTALVGDAAVDAGADPHTGLPMSGHKGGMAGAPESEIVALARQAIESYVRHGELPESPTLDAADLPTRAGAFVSLHRAGRLRGCIGTILPTRDTLAREVAGNAVEAATHDPRFAALDVGELDDLEISVDVLHAPESCTIADLDPERYGVVTSSGWRRGLLLPALDGVDDVETQVRIAMSKAGIQAGEPCSYERFRVDRYT